MSDLIKPVVDQFKFNSMILSLATGDIKNEAAGHRLRKGEGSSISYLMGHLLSSRYGILKMLGAGDENPYADQFGRNAGPRDGIEYPDISEFNAAWDELSPRFHKALQDATDDQLLAPAPDGFPVEDQTMRGAIAFLGWHEAYHVGQIGILRTEQGYPSTEHQVHAAMAAKS
jgi:uncharacterized damage-inducible protein DinB